MRRKIRKFAENKQTDNQRTSKQTIREQANKQSENSKTEATLSPVVCGSSGNAGQLNESFTWEGPQDQVIHQTLRQYFPPQHQPAFIYPWFYRLVTLLPFSDSNLSKIILLPMGNKSVNYFKLMETRKCSHILIQRIITNFFQRRIKGETRYHYFYHILVFYNCCIFIFLYMIDTIQLF